MTMSSTQSQNATSDGKQKTIFCNLCVVAAPVCLFGVLAISGFEAGFPVNFSGQKGEVVAPAISHTVTALGHIEPASEVIHLTAPAFLRDERVKSVQVRAGQKVQKGEVIAVMDSGIRLTAALEEAERRVDLCKARLSSVIAGAKKAEIEAEEASVQKEESELEGRRAQMVEQGARLKAEAQLSAIEYKRYLALFAQGAVSEAELDSKRTRMETSKARLSEADAECKRIEETCSKEILRGKASLRKIATVRPEDIAVARAELDEAIASASRIRMDLAMSEIRSSVSGHVLKVWAHPGESAGRDGIADIGQTEQMVAKADVYEADLKHVRSGQPARIRSQAFDGVLEGVVMETGWRVSKQSAFANDPGGNFDNRVVEVKVLLSPEASRRVEALTNLQVEVEIDPVTAGKVAKALKAARAE